MEQIQNWFDIYWFLPSTLKSFRWLMPSYFFGVLGIPILFMVSGLLNRKSQQKLHVSYFVEDKRAKWMGYLRFIPPTLVALGIVFILTALAQPQKTNIIKEKITEGIDIVLAIDVSDSMQSTDIKPNRLEVAKEVARKFIKGRVEDRIGLVVFAGDAYFLCPLTTDYDALFNYIDQINKGLVPISGTAIGKALGRCINLMRESKSKEKVAILISDGDNTTGELDPILAARLAKSFSIKTYAIAVGTINQKLVSASDTTNLASNANEAVDEAQLREIAKTSNGKFFRATNSKSLKDIFNQIDKLEKVKTKIKTRIEVMPMHVAYIKWAIVVLILALFIKNTFIGNILED
jgi:Ca-activated chloride channel family protein